MNKLALIVLGWVVLGMNAQAASFDCGKASTKVEHLICDNAELSKLDDELAVAYKLALKDPAQTESIKQTQRQWLKLRNGCDDAGCVKRAYEGRSNILDKSEQSKETVKSDDVAISAQTNKAKLSEQEYPHKSPKLRYTYCDRNKPELYCDGQTGKGYTVCDAYLKHLQSLTRPPTCEAPIPPSFKQPDWEEMDVTQHLDLAYQAEGLFLKKFGGYKHPDFDTWRQSFLQEIKEGKIDPRMRKTKVTPNDKGEATILAYTRDRASCHKFYEWETRRKIQKEPLPPYPISYWVGQGDVHFILTDDEPHALQVIIGMASRTQMDLLLYAGRPYLVYILEPLAPIYKGIGSNVRDANTSSIIIYSFDQRLPDRVRLNLDLNHYLADSFCQFTPY
ncbi:MAG: lysozyme inhibitor LprI family protein [Gallionellaceae bacterium]